MRYGTDELRKRWCLNHLAGKKKEFRNRGAAHANSLVFIVVIFVIYTDLRSIQGVFLMRGTCLKEISSLQLVHEL